MGSRSQRSGIRSHLEQGSAGHAEQVHSYGEFPEEFSGNVTQPSPLQPVQDKVQVGSDLDSSGPLIERPALTCWGKGMKGNEHVDSALLPPRPFLSFNLGSGTCSPESLNMRPDPGACSLN